MFLRFFFKMIVFLGLLCPYTQTFADPIDVKKVEKALKSLGKSYKEDIPKDVRHARFVAKKLLKIIQEIEAFKKASEVETCTDEAKDELFFKMGEIFLCDTCFIQKKLPSALKKRFPDENFDDLNGALKMMRDLLEKNERGDEFLKAIDNILVDLKDVQEKFQYFAALTHAFNGDKVQLRKNLLGVLDNKGKLTPGHLARIEAWKNKALVTTKKLAEGAASDDQFLKSVYRFYRGISFAHVLQDLRDIQKVIEMNKACFSGRSQDLYFKNKRIIDEKLAMLERLTAHLHKALKTKDYRVLECSKRSFLIAPYILETVTRGTFLYQGMEEDFAKWTEVFGDEDKMHKKYDEILRSFVENHGAYFKRYIRKEKAFFLDELPRAMSQIVQIYKLFAISLPGR